MRSRYGHNAHKSLERSARTLTPFTASSGASERDQRRQIDTRFLEARERVLQRPIASSSSPTAARQPVEAILQSGGLDIRASGGRTATPLGNRTDERSDGLSLATLDLALRRRLELPSAHLVPCRAHRRANYTLATTAFSGTAQEEERPPLVNWDARLTERDFGVIDGLIASARDGFPPPTLKREPPIARPAEYFERDRSFKWQPPELYCHNDYDYDYPW